MIGPGALRDASLRGVARVDHLVDFDLLHASMCGSQAIAATSVTYANASTRSRVTDNLCNFSFTTTRWRCYVASWRARGPASRRRRSGHRLNAHSRASRSSACRSRVPRAPSHGRRHERRRASRDRRP
ncbi:D-(-)-3-hydroxybutyrate oligomer hydrolase [Burkholderia multivorans]|nr:D-(-)-3-hydroxybutyrate oligomer hydrolase [Burkholderia multivorans]